MAPRKQTCPMCSFSSSDAYVVMLHFEEEHTEDSPFVIQDEATTSQVNGSQSNNSQQTRHMAAPDHPEDDGLEYMLCPEGDCGEVFLLTELNEHLDLHAAEKLVDDIEETPSSSSSSATTMAATRNYNPSFISSNFSIAIPKSLRDPSIVSASAASTNLSTEDKSSISRSVVDFSAVSSATDQKKLEKKRGNQSKKVYKSKRLGREELGPYAWEHKMPNWLYRQLEKGPKISLERHLGNDGRLIYEEIVENETAGGVQVLAQLMELDRTVTEAWVCHPAVLHVCKLPNEGGFCGYRNLQMLISYVQGSKAPGYRNFPGRTPGILKIQDWIEEGWDKGFNTSGRVETGGIRGTRKFIGTPEAQAFCANLNMAFDCQAFCDTPENGPAYLQLLNAVEKYFNGGISTRPEGKKVHKTDRAPIYLQKPGHSITVVGLEKRTDGSCDLLVYDPLYKTSGAMKHLLGKTKIGTARSDILNTYRRGPKQLQRYRDFETLKYVAFLRTFRMPANFTPPPA
ncbi:DUF1671-domain-containing protein [Aulographum hederae CBS 113979]|uniref:DUF1671-domain-containing protein n=1 Tax=Aulographum hederae CBS 113979 TaxID=1176131 RepID=A0A6G1GYI7_9PEZI|nr:DUF1671-domain-containing protein [Aulographum hederae CBS 113979]